MPAASQTRRTLGALVGIAVSLALLVWAGRGIDFADVRARAAAADLPLLLLSVAVATAAFPLRAIRWRALLLDRDGQPLPWAARWHATAAGFMGNNLLPFRAGEVLRAVAVTRLAPATLPSAFGSIAIERVFDGLTVVGLLVVGLFAADLPADVMIRGVSLARAATIAGVLSAGAFAAALVLVTLPGWSAGVVRAVLPQGLAVKVTALIDGLAAGVGAVRSPARLAQTVGWSLVHWLVNAAGFWMAAKAFGLSLSFPAFLLVQGVLAIGIAVPSSPGFVGVFEAAIVETLALFGVDRGTAFSYAAVYHVTTFLPITLLGLWSLSRTSLTLGGALADARAGD